MTSRNSLPFFILPIVILLSVSCSYEELASFPADELDELISSGLISEEDLIEEKISLLDPDGACFLALKAADKGYDETAAILARHSWKNSSGLIREKAAKICISSRMKLKNLADAEFLASLAAAEYPDSYYFRRTAVEAKYWQKEDEGLDSAIDELRKYPEAEDDYELYLFCAVSSFRVERRNWTEDWIELFENAPASDFIKRGWEYLELAGGKPEELFPVYADLITGKYLFSTGNYNEAVGPLMRFMENAFRGRLSGFDTEVLEADLENLFIRTGKPLTGARFFDALNLPATEPEVDRSADCEPDPDHFFTAARLYRRAGYYHDSRRCLDCYLDAGGLLTDRILWYKLDLAVKKNPAEAAAGLDYYTGHWHDPGFFSDVLDSLCTALVRRRDWRAVTETALILAESGPAESADRFRYISERAAAIGAGPDAEIPGVYVDAYYRILAGEWVPPESGPVTSAVSGPDSRRSWFTGLADFGLEHHLLSEIKKHRLELTEPVFIAAAESAAGAGYILDSIRIMYQYPGTLTSSGLKRLYPDAYRSEVEAAAERVGHPPALLFGIVWKESGFERDIVSSSGAVGLCQLMPATAEDVAGRTGLSIGDLTDPVENLALGSWYLGWLQSYVGNTAAAVISYNGGPGRVKSWIREYSDLPADLLYEAVPVAETHWYGKKVLKAAVLYGWFYYNIDPEDGMRLFFPGLSETD